MTIHIHEFSTGIQAEATADGGWVSQGFTGQYMNKTIDPIPRAVQEAITNRDFAVAEGASSDEPAFVGREVAGYGSEWSVIAVVTRGRDDRGRSASMYRYFLSEGLGNLGKILSWLNARKQSGQNIIFDPFDTQILGKPHEYSESEPDLALRPELKDLLESPPPIIIPSDSPCAPLIVNKMAKEIANGQLIAWGYKVEALEEPRGFKVIQPANSRAEDLLKRAIASKPNSPAPVSGEKAIISAINGLVKRDRVKPEQVETIENALANPQIDDNYWESIFKGRGTDKALRQGIYSADMVRLLTLRAMVIPETLPEFLAWIGKEGKQQESKQVSDTFQAEIKKSFSQVSGQGTNLISRVYQGVVSIIPRLIKQPQLLDSVVWLLSSDKGLWGYFYSRQVISEIDNDLSLMRSHIRGKQNLDFKLVEDKEWQKILNEIQVYWRSRSGSQPQYQPLAELFSQLGNYQLSALFHHISSGVVPKEVFYKLTRRGFRTQVYGVTVKRHIDFYEYLWITTVTIGGVELKAIVVFFILLSGFLMGGVSSKLFLKSTSEKSINQIAEKFTNAYKSSEFNTGVELKKVKDEIIRLFQDDTEITSVKDFKCVVADNLDLIEESCPISQKIIAKAKKDFSTSKKGLNKIEADIKSNLETSYGEKIKKLDDRIAELKQETQKDKEIKKVENERDNIITKKDDEIKKIKEAIRKNIIVNNSPPLDLQYCVFLDECDSSKQEEYKANWIKTIYSYQQNKTLKPDGILGDDTANQLKEEVMKDLDIPES